MPSRSVDAAPVLGPVYKRPGSHSFRTTTGLGRPGHPRNSGALIAPLRPRHYYSGKHIGPASDSCLQRPFPRPSPIPERAD